MPERRLVKKNEAALLVIDVQESFRRYLPDAAQLTRSISILLEASKILKLPVFLTEQYPQGLGRTMAEILACIGDHRYFEKTAFSCMGAESFAKDLEASGRKHILVCGIEAHVCVNQTVHDLIEGGYAVHLITDAISSRSNRNKDLGVSKMVGSGAVPSCLEMALFEMLCLSGTEEFKAVQRLIK